MFADLVVVQQFVRLGTKVRRQKGLKREVSRELGGVVLLPLLLVFPIAGVRRVIKKELVKHCGVCPPCTFNWPARVFALLGCFLSRSKARGTKDAEADETGPHHSPTHPFPSFVADSLFLICIYTCVTVSINHCLSQLL